MAKSFCSEQSQDHKWRPNKDATEEMETASSDTQIKQLQNGITAHRGRAVAAQAPYAEAYNKVISMLN
jgi:hypothetical protein